MNMKTSHMHHTHMHAHTHSHSTDYMKCTLMCLCTLSMHLCKAQLSVAIKTMMGTWSLRYANAWWRTWHDNRKWLTSTSSYAEPLWVSLCRLTCSFDRLKFTPVLQLGMRDWYKMGDFSIRQYGTIRTVLYRYGTGTGTVASERVTVKQQGSWVRRLFARTTGTGSTVFLHSTGYSTILYVIPVLQSPFPPSCCHLPRTVL